MINFFTYAGVAAIAYLFVYKLLPWIEGSN